MFVLRKFKVENVIVSVCFYEYDMLKATMDNNFDVVTKRLKEFVLELYSSMFEVSGMMSNNVPFAKSNEIKTNQLDFETMKHFDLMLPVDSRKKQKEKERKKEQIRANLFDSKMHANLVDGLRHGTIPRKPIKESSSFAVVERGSTINKFPH